MKEEEIPLASVFKNASLHRKIAGIIRDHLNDKADIRLQALNGLDLSNARNILDLGCGFGFFSEALQGLVPEHAVVTGIDRFPEYEWFFFQSCDKAGVKGDFRCDGIQHIEKLESNAYDLILCSYALYFFPEVIPHIARVLKKDGCFIAITHMIPHMPEFTSYIRGILKEKGLILMADLPYESLISRFSNENGMEMLNPFFSSIRKHDFKAILTFGSNDHEPLVEYFNFKHHFFIPEAIDPEDELHQKVVSAIKRDLLEGNGMRVSKNDIIFICTNPIIS
jgi:SAM-dependent methyltransferase